MIKKENLRDALLGQMDQELNRTPNIEQRSIQAMIAKETARLRVIQTLARCSWLLLMVCLAAAAIVWAMVRSINTPMLVVILMIAQLFLLIAVSLTGWHWARSRTLNMRQIQAALADIQEQLKKLPQDK